MLYKILLTTALILALVIIALLTATSTSAAASNDLVLNVNNTADVPDAHPGDGKCATAPNNQICTLRAAIMEANAHPGTEIINLQKSAVYVLSRPGNDTSAKNGDLDIATDLIINGGYSSISSSSGDRVFEIRPSSPQHHVFISQLGVWKTTITGDGAAFLNAGILTLSQVVLTQNSAGNGGAIWNDGLHHGSVTLFSSNISYNTASGFGGGIGNWQGSVKILNSTIKGNKTTSPPGGGGIFNGIKGASLIVIASTLSNNVAQNGGSGGGLYNEGSNGDGGPTATFVNSTIANNTASGRGGGIDMNAGTPAMPAVLYLYNTTIYGNVAKYDGSGAGIDNFNPGFGGDTRVNLWNTLIANNHLTSGTGPMSDCVGTLNSGDYNFIQTWSASKCPLTGVTGHNKLNQDPHLGTLSNNGSSTATIPLLAGSPAINAGNSGGCIDNYGATLKKDERGVARPQGSRCDIGAFEYVSP